MTLLIPTVVTADTFEKAVLDGNVKDVQHLLTRKCDFSKYFLLMCALTSGSHKMVKFLHENKLVDTFSTYQDIHTAIFLIDTIYNNIFCSSLVRPQGRSADSACGEGGGTRTKVYRRRAPSPKGDCSQKDSQRCSLKTQKVILIFKNDVD